MLKKLAQTRATAWVILIRILVGAVFISEALQKFIRPDELGVGRFARIGIPAPELTAPMVGGFEIVCGSLVLLGLLTRIAVVPLLVIIGVAIWTTDVPVFQNGGIWPAARAARADWSMLWGCLFLLIVGGGRGSVDAVITRRGGGGGGGGAA